jgi:flagellar export protein FliJ
MKAFHFSLQALKTLRQRQEQIALQSYAQALQLRQQAASDLSAARQELQAHWARWQSQIRAGCPALELVQSQAYCRVLEGRGRDCEAALRAAEEVTRQRWQSLLHARQQREAVDKFYAHQRRRHQRALEREEQKTIDELAHRPTGDNAASRLSPDMLWN